LLATRPDVDPNLLADGGKKIQEGTDQMKPGFGQRVLTAAILIPLVVAAIWWGPNWLVAVVSAAVAIAALREYFSIAAHL